ncbi:MAG TPA: LysR family transcriptional regulator [Kofleriaceae bacterium]|jgi:DNA-binding transcriptional LysR family regulator
MTPIAQSYDFDLVKLRYVHTIASCESMTAAAKQLRVSQPTLSNAVRDLERRLKTTLFLRGPRGVIPTASGKALLRTIDDVFALLHQAGDQIRGIESAAAGHFVIGCYHSFGSIYLPALMRGLAERAPAIELSLWEGIGPRVVDAVLDRTIHFGVGVSSAFGAKPHPELVFVPMFRDVHAAVRARGRLPPRAPLFYVPRVALSERVVAALRARGKLPERLVPCGDLELVKTLVLSGAGAGILPWRVALQGTPRGAIRLLDPSLPFEVDTGCFFYRADLHRTRGALLLRDELARSGRELDAIAMPCGVEPITQRADGVPRRR